MEGMAKVGQAKAYRLFEPEPVVWGLANEIRNNFEEAYIARFEISRSYKRELQSLVRKLDVLSIIVCQESLERFPGGEIRNESRTEVSKRAFRCSGLIHPWKPTRRVCGPAFLLESELSYTPVIRR